MRPGVPKALVRVFFLRRGFFIYSRFISLKDAMPPRVCHPLDFTLVYGRRYGRMIILAGKGEEKENHESLGVGRPGHHLLHGGPVRGLDAGAAPDGDGGGGGSAGLLGRTVDYRRSLPAGVGIGFIVAGGAGDLAASPGDPGHRGRSGGRDAGLDGPHDPDGLPPGPPGVGGSERLGPEPGDGRGVDERRQPLLAHLVAHHRPGLRHVLD